MKRSGFTMIELIFVIVILGILAAVAIPKLSATRDDAKISKLSANVSTLLNDAGAFYTSQGETNWAAATWDDVTNVELYTDTTGSTPIGTTTAITTDVYIVANPGAAAASDCVLLNATADGNLTIGNGGDTTSTVCSGVQTNIATMKKTHTFGGVGVVR
jgi:prepilin-type N-terminal cleavage/methylation domain-containing protein